MNKDEEIIMLQTRCLNLRHKTTAAENQCAVMRGEIEHLNKIIRIYETQITAARRAPSLGLCKKALLHAVDDVKDL